MEWEHRYKESHKDSKRNVVPGPKARLWSRSEPGARPGNTQDLLGNRRTGLLLRAQREAALVQAKLTVSKPGDRHEVEADRVADVAMSETARPPMRLTPWTPSARPTCGACQEEAQAMALQRRAHGSGDAALDEEEELLQAKSEPGRSDGPGPAAGPSVEASISSRRGAGTPLAPAPRAFFESRLGHDLGAVRLHTDPSAAELSKRLRAQAFTRGSDIFFAAGRYAPSSSEGKRLLAHELAHTLQQGGKQAVVRRDEGRDAREDDGT
jgi:hypothetical protein